MKLITNSGKKNHRALLERLIRSSDKIIICSGWMKQNGLKKLTSSLLHAIDKNGATVKFYTNEMHTEQAAIDTLHEMEGITHVLIPKNQKTLHSKIHYFQSKNSFTALIGSANITAGGLVDSEELSVEINGVLGSEEHLKIEEYLSNLTKIYC